MLLANHGALTLGADLFSAYYKMETIEHFAKSAWWRGCSAANGCCRGRRSSDCRGCAGMYGIASPAPICPPDDALGDPASCQTVLAPVATPSGSSPTVVPGRGSMDGDGEIRLTYRELSALIEAAVREIKVGGVS